MATKDPHRAGHVLVHIQRHMGLSPGEDKDVPPQQINVHAIRTSPAFARDVPSRGGRVAGYTYTLAVTRAMAEAAKDTNDGEDTEMAILARRFGEDIEFSFSV